MVNRIVNTRFPKLNTDNLVINSVQIDTSNSSTGQSLVFDGTKFAPSTISGGATVSNTAPSTPSVGDLWFDSTSASTYVYYDSSWVAVGPAIPDQIGELIAAKGDLIVANTASTATRLPVGSNGALLVANSSTTTGLEWSTSLTTRVTNLENLQIQAVSANSSIETAWAGKLIVLSPSANTTITFSTPALNMSLGSQLLFLNNSSFDITFAGSGVTLNTKSGQLKMDGQYSVVSFVKTDSTVFTGFGALKA